MVERAQEILETVIDFCTEHVEMLMIIGAAIVVIIVLIAVIKSIKNDDGEDLEFDEEDFLKELAEKTKKREEAAQQEAYRQALAKAAALEAEREAERETQQKLAQAAQKRTSLNPTTPYIENMLEEISGLYAQNLSEVEIKIQGAELKLRYSTENSEGEPKLQSMSITQPEVAQQPQSYQPVQEQPDEQVEQAQPAQPAQPAQTPEQAQPAETAQQGQGSKLAQVAKEIQEQAGRQSKASQPATQGIGGGTAEGLTVGSAVSEIEIPKEEADTSQPVQKFGPDNTNKNRSGDVFTETDLEKQIRD